ncbi:hypothetical protein [Absidia glauca]|uniref:Uncharacterized protein n=1 Tax=Absidia glauca TaxID=4829 RepID=A0A163IZR6_ABSGL|nr:hypothetical protein [Absidia glauca]
MLNYDFEGELEGQVLESKAAMYAYIRQDGRFLYRNFDVQNGIFSSNFFLTMYELVYLNPGTRDRRLRLVDTCAQSICLL